MYIYGNKIKNSKNGDFRIYEQIRFVRFEQFY